MKTLSILLISLFVLPTFARPLLVCDADEMSEAVFISESLFRYDSYDSWIFEGEGHLPEAREYERFNLLSTRGGIDTYYVQLADFNFDYYSFVKVDRKNKEVTISTYESDEGSRVEKLTFSCNERMIYRRGQMLKHRVELGHAAWLPGERW